MNATLLGIGGVLGISFLIFIHEMGHFLVAKACGVRVDKFSLGFGPVIVGFRRGETEYVLSWIPLGGYVKMAGENPGDPVLGVPDEFAAKPVWQRCAIALAGITMNAVFAVTAFSVAYALGMEATPPVVGSLENGAPAWAAGLREGDVILQVSETPVPTFEDLIEEVALNRQARVPLRIRRTGTDGVVTETTVSVERRMDKDMGIHRIGVIPPFTTVIGGILKPAPYPTPAERSGLLPGDRVTMADGKPVKTWKDLDRALSRKAGQEIDLTVDRGGASRTLKTKLWTAWTLGVEPSQRIQLKEISEMAARAGLRSGDQILTIDGNPIPSAEAFLRAVNQGELHALDIRVRRKDSGTETNESVMIEPLDSPEEGRRFLGVTYEAASDPDHLVLSDALPPEGAASRAGLKGGDELQALESGPLNQHISCWSDLEEALSRTSGGPLTLHYQRRKEAMKAVLDVPSAKPTPESLGLAPAVMVGAVRPGSPAAAAGILPRDRLQFVRLASPPPGAEALGDSASDWPRMNELIQAAGCSEGALIVSWSHDDLGLDKPNVHTGKALKPVPVEPLFASTLQTASILGAHPDGTQVIEIRESGLWRPVRKGFKRTWAEVRKIQKTVAGFFAPKGQALSPKALGGPISIFMGASHSLDRGTGSFLAFLAFVSVNLAVLNLLPVPVLDGGLVLLLLIEKAKGSPLGEKTQAIAQYGGLALVLTLVVFAFYNDIMRVLTMFQQEIQGVLNWFL